jgi:hypothetical protein
VHSRDNSHHTTWSRQYPLPPHHWCIMQVITFSPTRRCSSFDWLGTPASYISSRANWLKCRHRSGVPQAIELQPASLWATFDASLTTYKSHDRASWSVIPYVHTTGSRQNALQRDSIWLLRREYRRMLLRRGDRVRRSRCLGRGGMRVRQRGRRCGSICGLVCRSLVWITSGKD